MAVNVAVVAVLVTYRLLAAGDAGGGGRAGGERDGDHGGSREAAEDDLLHGVFWFLVSVTFMSATRMATTA